MPHPESSAFCPDCGPATVSHWVERVSAISEWILSPLEKPFGPIRRSFVWTLRRLHPEYLAIAFFHILAALRLGTITRDLDDRDNLRTKALWESAKKRGIEMREVRLFGKYETNFFVARYGNLLPIVFDGLPRPNYIARPHPQHSNVLENVGMSSESLDWMDDKGIMKKKFATAGIPVARGGTCFRLDSALKIFREVGPPLITKPNSGSRSRHTTVHIMNETELADAFRKAKELSPWVMVEEELQGMVYRGTVIGGNVVGVIRREFPFVTGNGKSTIRQLVGEENKNPLREGPVFHTIPMNEEVSEELAYAGLSWDRVPKKGQYVRLHQKMSRSFGAPTTDVTDITHPDNIALLEKTAEVLKDSVFGVDFIIGDISKSWREQKACGVIECNSLPFIDLHHYPFYGVPRDAAGELWKLIFPAAKLTSQPRAY